MVTEGSIYAQRIEVVSDAFKFTEYYAEMQGARRALVEATLAEKRPLSGKISAFLKARARFENYAEHLLQDPMHARLEYLMRLNQSDPVPMALGAAVRLGDSLEGLDLLDYAANLEIAKRWVEDPGQFVELLWNEYLAHQFGLGSPHDFYEPRMPKIYQWTLGFRAAEDMRVTPVASNQGLLVEHADYLTMYTDVRLKSVRDYMIEFEIDYRCRPDNRVYLQAMWKDADKKTIQNEMLLRMPNGSEEHSGRILIPVRSPEGAEYVRIRIKTVRQYPGDYLKISRAQLHADVKVLPLESKS